MRYTIKALPIFALVFGLAGCGTMINQSVQEVEVQTPGVEQVGCVIKNDKYTYRLLAPSKINLERSPYELTMTCSKYDYETVEVILPPSINPSTYWNTLNGVIPGTVYDIGAHGAYKYPDIVVVEMYPLSDDVVEPDVSGEIFYETPVVIAPNSPAELYNPEDNYAPADDVVEDSFSGRK